jgi:hypothetical protein
MGSKGAIRLQKKHGANGLPLTRRHGQLLLKDRGPRATSVSALEKAQGEVT